jgi:transposase-like protein
MVQYLKFACPNPACTCFRQTNLGNIVHRSWGGKNKAIERLRCTSCGKEFSSHRGSLLENSKLSVEAVETILKCLRWGVCEEGAADIASVDRKTVRRLQREAARRAEIHHNNEVIGIKEAAVQCDELYAKMAGSVSWLGAAIGVQSLMILAIAVGSRSQALADRLASNLWVRCAWLPMLLTDGWKPYFNAFLRCFGKPYQPRRTGRRGRKKGMRLKFPDRLYYAQVIKRTKRLGKRWQLKSVVVRSMSGGLRQCKGFIRLYRLGQTIHTIHIERWFGSLRCCTAALRRRSRCSLRDKTRLTEKTWVFVSLYNWVVCHRTLSRNGSRTTPAMAAGLATAPLTYREYITMPVFEDPSTKEKIERRIQEIQTDEMKRAVKRSMRPPPEEEIVWKERVHREAA